MHVPLAREFGRRREWRMLPGLYDLLSDSAGVTGEWEAVRCAYFEAVCRIADRDFSRLEELERWFRRDRLPARRTEVGAGPESALLHLDRGCVLLGLGRSEEALEAFDRVVSLDPKSAAAHAYRGEILNGKGEHQRALNALDLAMEHGLDGARVQVNRGIALGNLGKLEEALTALDKARQLNRTGRA